MAIDRSGAGSLRLPIAPLPSRRTTQMRNANARVAITSASSSSPFLLLLSFPPTPLLFLLLCLLLHRRPKHGGRDTTELSSFRKLNFVFQSTCPPPPLLPRVCMWVDASACGTGAKTINGASVIAFFLCCHRFCSVRASSSAVAAEKNSRPNRLLSS